MTPPTRAVRRFAGAVTFAAVAGGLALPLLAAPAGAVQDTTTRRLEGDDRYETAAAVAADTFPDGAESVVLATGQDFADALAANGLAGALDAPVLLTLRDRLPEATADALADLDPTTVHVMGGTAAVSKAVADELAADFTVERIEGTNRYETAAAAGQAIADTDDGVPATTDDGIGTTGDDGRTAVLANGTTFPDAVSGGPVAFAGRLPVLLTSAGTLAEATASAIEDLEIEYVLIVGGTAAVSAAVEDQVEDLGVTVERLAGGDRWATNVAVNGFAAEALDFGGPTAYLSTGSKFPDALTGGPAAGANASPMLLTASTSLPSAIRSYLQANGNAIDDIVAIGGTAAIDAATLAAAADAAQLDSNRLFQVTPAEAATRPLSSAFLTNEGARSFTVTGLEPGGAYVVALLDAETVDPSGGVTFTSYSLSDEAATSIESVNGSTTGAAGGVETVKEALTAAADGSATFTIDATEADAVVPVVFQDLDADGTLTLAGQVADEPFGIGGKTTWLPGEAADDSYDDVVVTAVSTADNYFVAGGDTFLFDANDRFRSDIGELASQTITPAQFEGMITVGDVVDVTYFRGAQSLFDVVTDTLPDISAVTASTPSSSNPNLVQVSWAPSAQPDAVYTVYRDNGNGSLGDGDVVVSPAGAATSRQFVEPTSSAGVRYIVLPAGGTSKTPDTTNAAGNAVTFTSNEIVPGVTLFGLTEGTTVSRNAGLSLLNAGDQWMLHFSREVQVAPGATITVKQGAAGTPLTLTNGTTQSTWVAEGRTITITLGAGADAAPDLTYGDDTTVTGLTGVRDLSGTTISETALRDRVLEDDGPELMVESTTCDVGDTSCTIAFNEPVSESSAESRASYGYAPDGGGRFLNSITLGADQRTITLSIAPGAGAGDRIRPVGAFSAVNDDDAQASDQAAFDFVR